MKEHRGYRKISFHRVAVIYVVADKRNKGFKLKKVEPVMVIKQEADAIKGNADTKGEEQNTTFIDITSYSFASRVYFVCDLLPT